MKSRTSAAMARVQEAEKLIDKGMRMQDALKKVGTGSASYYLYRGKNKKPKVKAKKQKPFVEVIAQPDSKKIICIIADAETVSNLLKGHL